MADFDNTNKGAAFKNAYKTSDKSPIWRGKGNFDGLNFEFDVWENKIKQGEHIGETFLSFTFKEPYVKPASSGSSEIPEENPLA